MSANTLAWQQPGWLEQAQHWIRAELQREQIQILGEIEQPHIRPWSTVLRVATNDGLFFFKATAAYFGHETALTAFLARHYPQLSPQVFASDLERHWLLMRDSGTALRTSIRASRMIAPWRGVLPLYVELQKNLSARRPELLAMGVPDRRLERMPALFHELLQDESAMLLDQPESLTRAEFERLRAFGPRFEQMCAHLAGSGIPESLHHDDFHDGNIFLQDGRIVFTDWGESAVTHPFFTLVVMLRSVENSLDVQPDAPEVQSLREWYLALWSDYASVSQLRPVVALAERIGYVNRALTWQKLISQLPEDLKPEYASGVPAYLKEFINSVGPE
jgi:hypothetical protein